MLYCAIEEKAKSKVEKIERFVKLMFGTNSHLFAIGDFSCCTLVHPLAIRSSLSCDLYLFLRYLVNENECIFFVRI